VRIDRHLLPLHDDRVLLHPQRLLARRVLYRLHARARRLIRETLGGAVGRLQWQAATLSGVVWQLAAEQQ
jgi:hypothetical protein